MVRSGCLRQKRRGSRRRTHLAFRTSQGEEKGELLTDGIHTHFQPIFFSNRLGDDLLLDCKVTSLEKDLVSWFRKEVASIVNCP